MNIVKSIIWNNYDMLINIYKQQAFYFYCHVMKW